MNTAAGGFCGVLFSTRTKIICTRIIDPVAEISGAGNGKTDCSAGYFARTFPARYNTAGTEIKEIVFIGGIGFAIIAFVFKEAVTRTEYDVGGLLKCQSGWINKSSGDIAT